MDCAHPHRATTTTAVAVTTGVLEAPAACWEAVSAQLHSQASATEYAHPRRATTITVALAVTNVPMELVVVQELVNAQLRAQMYATDSAPPCRATVVTAAAVVVRARTEVAALWEDVCRTTISLWWPTITVLPQLTMGLRILPCTSSHLHAVTDCFTECRDTARSLGGYTPGSET